MANKLLVALGVACVAFGECLESEFDVKVARLVQIYHLLCLLYINRQ